MKKATTSGSPGNFSNAVHGRVGFRDLGAEIAVMRGRIDAAIGRVLDSGRLLLGVELEGLEEELGDWHGGMPVAGVASGLAALRLLMRAMGIGCGDGIMVASNTYIATWLAVSGVGGRVIPVEPDMGTRNLSVAALPEVPEPGVRALLVTHLYGLPCDMEGLAAYAKQHDLLLLVDAAQSMGAEWKGSRAACMGDGAALSFYPTKNLGGLGDGGAVVSPDAAVVEKVRVLRNYGMRSQGEHEWKGENARLEEMHAAVLRERLGMLDGWQERRGQLAAKYMEGLAGIEGVALPEVPEVARHAWHLFTVLIDGRDGVRERMLAAGVETAVHYPVPPHLSGAYGKEFGGMGQFPVAEKIAATVLSLPLHPLMEDWEVERVCAVLGGVIGGGRVR